MPLSNKPGDEQSKQYQEAYAKALQMQASLLPGKQQVVTYNFEGFTPPPEQIEEAKVSKAQPQDIKPVAKPEQDEHDKGNGGNKSARGKKTHKKKIYNY